MDFKLGESFFPLPSSVFICRRADPKMDGFYFKDGCECLFEKQ